MKLTRVSTNEQLLESSAICDAISLAAGILARRGAKRPDENITRAKIAKMLKARDDATRCDAATAVQKRS